MPSEESVFACAFCASGRRAFIRHLTPAEIVGQVYFLKDRLEANPTNIVFMCMGEPLDNFENLAKALGLLNSPRGLGIAARRMTVSTAGIIPGIEGLGKLGLQVNLDGLVVRILGQQRDGGARLAITLDGHFYFQASHHDLAVANIGLTTNRHQVAIKDAGVAHAHALDPQQVMGARIEQREIEAITGLDVFSGQNRLAGGHPPHQRQALLLAGH